MLLDEVCNIDRVIFVLGVASGGGRSPFTQVVIYDLNGFRRNRVYDLNIWSAGEKAREKAVAIEREMGRERERREER